jgi:hypothetical protein
MEIITDVIPEKFTQTALYNAWQNISKIIFDLIGILV